MFLMLVSVRMWLRFVGELVRSIDPDSRTSPVTSMSSADLATRNIFDSVRASVFFRHGLIQIIRSRNGETFS